MPTALMIAHGTAVRALEASSLICTEASKPPKMDGKFMSAACMTRNSVRPVPIVHRGARKLSTNAKPFGHPLTDRRGCVSLRCG